MTKREKILGRLSRSPKVVDANMGHAGLSRLVDNDQGQCAPGLARSL
jgi:hypothetical protein